MFSLSPSNFVYNNSSEATTILTEGEIDEIKSKLLMRRGAILFGSGAEEEFDLDLDDEDLLNEDAIEYLLDLL